MNQKIAAGLRKGRGIAGMFYRWILRRTSATARQGLLMLLVGLLLGCGIGWYRWAGGESSATQPGVTTTGRIARRAWLPYKTTATYGLKLAGDKKHTFVVTSQVYSDAAFLLTGDEVSLTHPETESKEVLVTSLRLEEALEDAPPKAGTPGTAQTKK